MRIFFFMIGLFVLASCGKDYSDYDSAGSDDLILSHLDHSILISLSIYRLRAPHWPTAKELSSLGATREVRKDAREFQEILKSFRAIEGDECRVAVHKPDEIYVLTFYTTVPSTLYVRVLRFKGCSLLQPVPGESEFGVHGLWTQNTGELLKYFTDGYN